MSLLQSIVSFVGLFCKYITHIWERGRRRDTYRPFPKRWDSKWSSEYKTKSKSESRNYRCGSLFTFSNENRFRTMVSEFRFRFRFALRWPFRVSSFEETFQKRAVRAFIWEKKNWNVENTPKNECSFHITLFKWVRNDCSFCFTWPITTSFLTHFIYTLLRLSIREFSLNRILHNGDPCGVNRFCSTDSNPKWTTHTNTRTHTHTHTHTHT